MSDMEIDYLPFDYVTYMQQILPALHRVLEGDEVPLVTLLQPLSHISFGPRSLLRLPLSPENTNWLLEGRPFHRAMSLEGLLDASTLSRVRAGEPLDPWQALAKVIPFLKGRSLNSLGRYGEMLHFHLFYTLCTGPSTLSEMYKSSLLPHDEHIFRWREYTDRDEEMRALWGTFYQAASEAFTQYTASQENSRRLRLTQWCRESIIGFLTPEETQYFLEHVRTQEKPELPLDTHDYMHEGARQGWAIDRELPISNSESLWQMLDNSAWSWKDRIMIWMAHNYEEKRADIQTIVDYWLTVHPEETQEYWQRYYEYLWRFETEILYRMRQAAVRGWGMIQTCYT